MGRRDSWLWGPHSFFVFFQLTIILQSRSTSATINELTPPTSQSICIRAEIDNKANIFLHQVRIHHHEIEEKIDDVFRLTARIVVDTTRHERKWWLNERVEGAPRRDGKIAMEQGMISYEQCWIADDGTWPILATGNTWTMTRFLVYGMLITFENVHCVPAWI